MAETRSQPRAIRFGAFEADMQTGELRKDGVKLKFGGQPFQVLAILLEHPGDVVTREELQKRLWPDTFVDVERNLNTAVNKIREVLGDSAESPRFIETLSRRGYRFIGELEESVQSVGAAVTLEPDRAQLRRRMWLKIGSGVIAISVVALAVLGAYRWKRQPLRPQEQAAMTAFPFTALPGDEISAAFSPDGSRIAFAWNGDPATDGKGFELYVKAIGSETLLRVTQHPSEWLTAAWSPDGAQIALHRIAGADSGIYIVPALGGPERKLRSTRISADPMISWSPDGKWIALSDLMPGEDRAMVYLLSTETLETTQIPNDSKCFSQDHPAFSHSGEYLAYWCHRNQNEASLNSLQLASGHHKVILPFQGAGGSLTWKAGDGEIIYSLSLGAESQELYEVRVANGSVTRLGFAGSANMPTVSSKGDRFAFTALTERDNIQRKDLLNPGSPAVGLVPSTRSQMNARYSPDGKRLAFASDRSGVWGIWVSNVDGSGLVQVSSPHVASGSPQWSPDGTKIAFDSRPVDGWEIYVADLTEGNPRKLVTSVSRVFRPHWSSDGKWIYFRSYEAGKTGVYRCPATGGDAIALSRDIDGFSPRESLDGTTIYFASHGHNSVLKRVALQAESGTESEVEGLPRILDSELWTLSPRGIYFVPAAAPRSLRYFDFATRQVQSVFEAEKDFRGGLSVSPDGHWILYPQVTDTNSDIMLVDHFH
jgi:Tol biopolymer transport system component/DNA-binding winged helix-turn-helix (wHTH) protein